MMQKQITFIMKTKVRHHKPKNILKIIMNNQNKTYDPN